MESNRLQNGLRVLVAGGGSGGHATPALAIAEAFRRRDTSSQFLFVGTEQGVEARMVPKAGFEIDMISVISLSRSLNASLIRFPFVLLKGFAESLLLVRRFRPDLTLCTGGYVSGPVGLASVVMGVPLAIHDSNVLPGITLRILSRAAAFVMLGFSDASRKVGGRLKRVVGNPTRLGESELSPGEARASFGLDPNSQTLLVVGGSQGARSINAAVEVALPKLMDQGVQVLWQTGSLDYDARKDSAEPHGDRVAAVPFIDDMVTAYEAADLAITRAGAMTIAELNLYGVPAILVPLEISSENHQQLNARAMEREGWARVILQRDIDGERLAGTVSDMIDDSTKLERMAARSLKRGSDKAADQIVVELSDSGLIRA